MKYRAMIENIFKASVIALGLGAALSVPRLVAENALIREVDGNYVRATEMDGVWDEYFVECTGHNSRRENRFVYNCEYRQKKGGGENIILVTPSICDSSVELVCIDYKCKVPTSTTNKEAAQTKLEEICKHLDCKGLCEQVKNAANTADDDKFFDKLRGDER